MRKKSRLLSLFSNLGKDEDGGVLIYFTVMLPVIVGMIGLALEGGQFHHLNSDLQELADAASLAGAAELDGANDAITRAIDKATNLLSNDPHWSNVAKSGAQITTPTFYSNISSNGDTVTTDPTQATYIKVTTVTRQVQPAFLAAIGAGSIAGTSASAVAGSNTVACNVQPLMLCNPYEGTSEFHATPGQLFEFVPAGGGSGLSPGDFALVDPSGQSNSSAKDIRNLLAAATPNFCYVDNVSPRPGQVTQDVNDGINVRFDEPPQGAAKNDPSFDQTPAPDVIKGEMPDKPADACKWNKYQLDSTTPSNTSSTPNTGMLPGDTDMTPEGHAFTGNTMDTPAANAYWNYHHGANWPANTTRFQAYCQELGLGSDCLGSNTPPSWAANTEGHAPQCAPVGTGNYKRRIISVAVVDCLANNVKGNSATNLRSNTFGEFFITQPANGTIFAEFIQFFTPGSCDSNSTNPYCNALHKLVQLYR